MTHGEIDEMKAGPALDKLACEALGIGPSYEWWVVNKINDGLVIKGSEIFSSGTDEQRCEVWCRQHDTDIYERRAFARWLAISTDPAAMVAAIPRFTCVTFVSQEKGMLALVNQGMRMWQALGETAMEAFARAAAKTKEG